jgi:hypothetical protein
MLALVSYAAIPLLGVLWLIRASAAERREAATVPPDKPFATA